MSGSGLWSAATPTPAAPRRATPPNLSARIAMATPNHVENPLEYAFEKLAWGVRDFAKFLIPHPERHAGQAVPQVRRIGLADLRDALRQGVEDVGALRDDVLFIGLIYPLAGLVLATAASNTNFLPMLFPLAS